MKNPQISAALPVWLPSLAELFLDVPEVRGAGGVWYGVVNSTLVQFPRWLVAEDTRGRRTDRHWAARLRLHRIPQAHAWPLAFRAAPALGIELLWKEKREFWSSAKAAGRSFVVVFMLLSSGRAITHLVKPKPVSELSGSSTSGEEMKLFGFMGHQIQRAEQREAPDAILSRLTYSVILSK